MDTAEIQREVEVVNLSRHCPTSAGGEIVL